MSLIDKLVMEKILCTPEIIKAMRKIRRADFLLESNKHLAELDQPLPIGFSQTNSQPTTVALMLELLQPKLGDKVLDVGSGSGWTAALLAELVKPAKVYGLEIIPDLVEFAQKNVAKYDNNHAVEIQYANGNLGLRDKAYFDKIIVSAASAKIPQLLLEQLAIGGKLVAPVGSKNGIQELILIEKTQDGNITEKRIPGFRFVPLIIKDL